MIQTEVKGNTITRHELVWRGYKPQPAYTPAEKTHKPLIADRSYIRIYGVGRMPEVAETLSEVRRRQIKQQVIVCRKAIRVKAETYWRDKDTKITAVTTMQKVALHSEKLMSNLLTSKQIS